MLYLSDSVPSGGPSETKKKLGSVLSAQRHHNTSDSEAHRAPGHFLRTWGRKTAESGKKSGCTHMSSRPMSF